LIGIVNMLKRERRNKNKVQMKKNKKKQVSLKDCIEALQSVIFYCQQREFAPFNHNSLSNIENQCVSDVIEGNKVQKHMKDFFG